MAYEGRSFSIGDTEGNLIFDSGDDIEQRVADLLPNFFNVDFDVDDDEIVDVEPDNRGDNSGPEPEGVALAQINNRWIAFIGLEKMGGVIVYDITDPTDVHFIDYINLRDFEAETAESGGGNNNFNGVPDGAENSNIAPEGMFVIPAEQSPTAGALLVIGCEDSGSIVIYEINLRN